MLTSLSVFFRDGAARCAAALPGTGRNLRPAGLKATHPEEKGKRTSVLSISIFPSVYPITPIFLFISVTSKHCCLLASLLLPSLFLSSILLRFSDLISPSRGRSVSGLPSPRFLPPQHAPHNTNPPARFPYPSSSMDTTLAPTVPFPASLHPPFDTLGR